MVKYALEKMNLNGSVFAYGDNVIAPLKIPKSMLENKFSGNYDGMLLYFK